MQIIKHDINIDFVGKRKLALVVSAVAILIGLASLVVNGGPNYGIDFVGGFRSSLPRIPMPRKSRTVSLRSILAQSLSSALAMTPMSS